MALSANRLATAIQAPLKAQIISNLAALKARYNAVPNDNRATGFDQDTYQNDYFEALVSAICTVVPDAIINEITGNAIASGVDSRGDTHALTIT